MATGRWRFPERKDVKAVVYSKRIAQNILSLCASIQLIHKTAFAQLGILAMQPH